MVSSKTRNNLMYDPQGNGKVRNSKDVSFSEAEPPGHLRGIVHRFLELRTDKPLIDDYRFHALPDACTYVVFDQLSSDISGVTKLRASSEELNLGNQFHYINVRFLPGVWQQDQEPILHGMISKPYDGSLPLSATNLLLTDQDWKTKQITLTRFVENLVAEKVVIANQVAENIFRHIDDIHSVADMADASHLSPRQLQRVLKKTTGFTPHDFLKVLRLQQSLRGEPSLSYADQSHFIHSFKKATGYTPGQYARKFDV